jgi:hypothetical protein
MFGAVIEGTVTLVILYLIVANSDGFSKAVEAIGGVYKNSVVALQGRS